MDVILVIGATAHPPRAGKAPRFVEHVAPAERVALAEEESDQAVRLRALTGVRRVAENVERQARGVLIQVARAASGFKRTQARLEVTVRALLQQRYQRDNRRRGRIL